MFRIYEAAVRGLRRSASSWHWRRAGLEQGKIPCTRRWRVTNYGRNVMGTSMYLREHHFPNVYSRVVH